MTTTTKRTGTLDGPHRNAAGKLFWRGKVRLKDGTRKSVQIPEPERYDEAEARKRVEWLQAGEDKFHTLYQRKLAELVKAGKSPAPFGSPDATWTIAAYRKRLFEKRRASGRVEDVDSEECRRAHEASRRV